MPTRPLMSFEHPSSSSRFEEEFDTVDSAPLSDFEPLDWDSWGGEECPVCGVPWGTGGCFRCLFIAAEVFDVEDHLDGL